MIAFLLLITLLESVFGGLVNVNSNFLNASAVDDNGAFQANLTPLTLPSNRSALYDYANKQLLARYYLERRSNGDLDVGNDGLVPFNITVPYPRPLVDTAAEFFNNTVVDGVFRGNTGSVFLNRLAQEAAANGVPLTDVFSVTAGNVHLKV